jgi:hypothetical protein
MRFENDSRGFGIDRLHIGFLARAGCAGRSEASRGFL